MTFGLKPNFIYPLVYGTLSIAGTIKKKILNEKEIIILAFHRVLDIEENFNFYKDVVTTNPNDFIKQMQYISEKYNVVSFNKLTNILQGNRKLTDDLLLITFDDGYVDFKTHALPALKKYNLPAVVFVTPYFASHRAVGWWEKLAFTLKKSDKNKIHVPETRAVDLEITSITDEKITELCEDLKKYSNKQRNEIINRIIIEADVEFDEQQLSKQLYLGWDELKKIKSDGIEIGSHSLTHPILTKLDSKELLDEIILSKHIIEEKISSPVNTFCYPNGRQGDFNASIIELLMQNGYDYSVTMMFGSNQPNKKAYNPYTLRRFAPINHKFLHKQLKSTPVSSFLNMFL